MLTGGGPNDLVKRLVDYLVYMCGGGCQVVKMGAEIISQVHALGENAGFSVEQVRVGGQDNAVDKL